jgi:hypothetical protein
LKLVQERAGDTMKLRDIENEFLNTTQMAQQIIRRIGKRDYYMKLKSCCTTKETVIRL